MRASELLALARGYAATAHGALALRFGLNRPPVDSLEFFEYRRRWNLRARDGFGLVMHVDGPRPTRAGTLLVANHASFADLNVLVCESPAGIKLSFVAKAEVGEVPVFGWHMKRYGDLLFDRKDPSARHTLVSRAIARLESGFSVGLFPEGTRSRDGRPKAEIQPALIDAAIARGLTVQPVAIAGTRGLIESFRTPHRGHPVYARFGEPRLDYAGARDVWSDVLRLWSEIAPIQEREERAEDRD